MAASVASLTYLVTASSQPTDPNLAALGLAADVGGKMRTCIRHGTFQPGCRLGYRSTMGKVGGNSSSGVRRR